MKFETFDFHVTQLGYVKVAVDNITGPVFRPDGKGPTDVAAMQTAADVARIDLLASYDNLNMARANLEMARKAGHDAAVAVYACMKSCYRSDATAMPAIRRLPKDDFTAAQTLSRMVATSGRWAELPNVPGQTGSFVVGTLTKAGFDLSMGDLNTKMANYRAASAQFQSQQDAFRQGDDTMAAFITASLVQGRALYKQGTPQRGFIDAIPTEPAQQEPAEALITVAESQGSGAVHLEFTAEHATGFQVWHKGPADPAFSLVAEVLLPGTYLASGLSAGEHEYQVVGVNSRGEGPASATSSVTVAVAAAA